MLGKLRKKIKPMLFFLAKPFAALGVHPNAVTLLGIPFALAAAYFIFQQQYLNAFFFVILAVLMDLIDGSVAGLSGKRSYFGNYFETMVDKYVEFIVFSGFVFAFPLETVLLVGLSLIESYAKPRVALVIIADNRDWPALGEHADKFALLLAGLFVSAFFPAAFGYETMRLFLLLLILVVFVGGIQRILYARKLIREAQKKGRILPYLKKGLGHKPVK